jgi:hypothetical protein
MVCLAVDTWERRCLSFRTANYQLVMHIMVLIPSGVKYSALLTKPNTALLLPVPVQLDCFLPLSMRNLYAVR